MEERQILQQLLGRLGFTQSRNVVHIPHPTHVNSKCSKVLDLRYKTLKVLKENIGKTVQYIGKDFLNRNPVSQKSLKTDKWDYEKLSL